jgi:hypothetical protein
MKKNKEEWIDEMMGELDNWHSKKMNPLAIQSLKHKMIKTSRSQKFSTRTLLQIAAAMLLLVFSNVYIVINNIEKTTVSTTVENNPYQDYLQSYTLLPLDLQNSSYE